MAFAAAIQRCCFVWSKQALEPVAAFLNLAHMHRNPQQREVLLQFLDAMYDSEAALSCLPSRTALISPAISSNIFERERETKLAVHT